jgi:hypothetical protein
MNALVESAMAALPPNTLLIVMGDHGARLLPIVQVKCKRDDNKIVQHQAAHAHSPRQA